MANPAPVAEAPQPLLSPQQAVAIIVGIVIGAGIFGTPSLVAGIAGDAGWVVVAWVLGAVISLAGALCYAELATTYPHAGGDYHFLTRAFGRPVSFLYAWARAMVINTGAIAILAFLFGDYVSRIAPLGAASSAIWAAAIIVVLTAVNIVGLQASARTQIVLTVIEVVGLVAVAIAGFVATPEAASPPAFSSTPAFGTLAFAMIFVLFTYGGWNEAAYISAELKGGRRAIVPVLITSLAILAVIYVVANIAMLNGLGLKGLAGSKAAGADVMARAFGPLGAQILSLIVAIAALTSINATMIVGARTNYAMGRDWPALRFMGGWSAAKGTPVAALIVQAVIALALVVFGSFQNNGFKTMVEFTAPVFWTFLFLVGIALFRLRAKDAAIERPFRVPLYPITPVVFCAACAWLAYSSITYAASRSAVHIALIVMAVGVVALLITRMKRSGSGPAIASD
ncbi:MAG TPA: amino acid permease [Casimicrobiaceae bacterium]|nr:amino acid permease [Casimicrobiaceae bacterium]